MKHARFVCILVFTAATLASAQSKTVPFVGRMFPAESGVFGATTGTVGFFAAPVAYDSGGWRAESVAMADLNGDGKLDLVVANGCSSNTNCLNGVVGVLLGNGDGTFQNAVLYGSGGGGGYLANSVTIADVNGDGKPDLLVANRCEFYLGHCGSDTIGVLLGNGDGTFRTTVVSNSGRAKSIAAVDVNRDGKLDLVVANECTFGPGNCPEGTVGILLGNGDGTFRAGSSYRSGGLISDSVAVGDFNGGW